MSTRSSRGVTRRTVSVLVNASHARAKLRKLTELLVSRLPAGPGQRVLDLGCGHGGPAIAVARGTGADVTGIGASDLAS